MNILKFRLKLFILLAFLVFINRELYSNVNSDTTKVEKCTYKILYSKVLNVFGQKEYSTNLDVIEDNSFIKKRWSNKWYYYAGVGYTFATLKGKLTTNYFPEAGHLSSVIGYYDKGGYGFEVGSYIDVINMEDVSIPAYSSKFGGDNILPNVENVDMINWNTMFYIGIRARVPGIEPTDLFNPFVKLFYGRSVGVFFLESDEDVDEDLSDKRIHMEGPVYGISFSNFFNSKSDKPIWFIELTLSTQIYQELIYVQENSELPLELLSTPYEENTLLSTIRLSIGVRLF